MAIASKPWKKNSMPRRVLAIRLQAMGDLVITLPYLQHLRNSLPAGSKIDLLTREEVDSIPNSLQLFNKVYSIGGGRNFKKQVLHTALLLPRLLWQRYEVVIDLQNNIISRSVRKAIMPKAWSEFDRCSPMAAGDRTRLTIDAVGIKKSLANHNFEFKRQDDGIDLLKSNGWLAGDDLVLLNPAGAFKTRNWPLDNYVSFARLWLEQFPHTKFLVMGTSLIDEKALFFKQELRENLVNLVNKTKPAQAFAIMQKVKFVLSEDSGLMHMAWVSGVPTLALFGSTKSYMAKPLGKHATFLDSSDLECGNCMLEICKYADTHCLTRYTPAFVFNKAMNLLKSIHSFSDPK